ncbi:ureidoglycolate lyase [Aliiroseovarius halocynthiae]|uniref:Ureidoglycolate lyase n=1 Tax=Aliiroseovarius halocynthiae TaxID=985055 RepID=A0A545SQ37_9RHOB|nr:ureidoglycolate lyase [Aliiroseovarius halocynthiae]TQV67090.1 ureidoglycolate lyase [Aliiroseovarius halocynthiae]SMR82186.1 ureidoglycolate lyase [Aliiroseovarius halocynthiae]
MTEITAQPLTAGAFAPFGDVLELTDRDSLTINAGMCQRHHDLAQLDFGEGRAGISLFDGKARHFPYALDMVERHPLGSQAFIPMNGVPLLVSVCPDKDGAPGTPHAFIMRPDQAVNLHKGTWHGVLAPIAAQGLYAVVDRIGGGENLEEFRFADPVLVHPPSG